MKRGQGPAPIFYPGTSLLSCWRCEHFFKALPRTFCEHPEIADDRPTLFDPPGREISAGRDSTTPEWCPFLRPVTKTVKK